MPKDANQRDKTLVLDLDETLVFATLEPQARVDHEMHLAGQDVFVQVRPGARAFLDAVQADWTVMIWSTGQPIYVDAVCEHLGLGAGIEAWGRDRCRRLEVIPEHHHEPYDKPLARVDAPLDRVVIVDNAPGTFACNPDNGIPITAWHGDLADQQLRLLAIYLRWLAAQPDVRRNHWRWAIEVMTLRNTRPEDHRDAG